MTARMLQRSAPRLEGAAGRRAPSPTSATWGCGRPTDP